MSSSNDQPVIPDEMAALAVELEEGIAFHREGNLALAMQVYANLLAQKPDYADALHLMGEALYRQGRFKQALGYLNLAVSIAPHHFFLNTRANVLLAMGLLMEAQQDLKRALSQVPNYAEAYVNLSAVYRQQKKFRQAREAAANATRLMPDSPAAWNNAAAIDMEQGHFDEAIELFNHALQLAPNYTPAYKNIAKIRVHQSFWDLALAPLEKAAEDLNDLEAQYLLARAYRLHRRFEDAVPPLQRAMRNLSLEDRAAAMAGPYLAETLYAVCSELDGVLSRPAEAIELYQLALDALPNDLILSNNLGASNFRMGNYAEAIQVLTKTLEINPDLTLARVNLGVNQIMMGNPDAAIAEFERCLVTEPGHMGALGWLIGEKCNLARWDGLKDLRNQVAVSLDDPSKTEAINSFILLSNYEDVEQLHRWTKKAATQMYDSYGIQPLGVKGAGRAHKRIRLAYYSFDIRNHPVAHLTAELFGLHNRDEFEVFVYSYGPDDGHPVRARIVNSVEHFMDVQAASIKQMAERIRDDEIDILVDLSGNTRGAKPQLIAYRAAPVQVMWLGYIGTTGTNIYDYLIADSFVIPEGFEQHYEEKILRLPNTFQVTDSKRSQIDRAVRREDYGLPENAFIFCDFNQSFKIQPEMFAVWVRIMKRLPGSVIWLLQGHPSFEPNLRAEWERAGLSQERLIVSPRVPIEEHLARVALADLFIDTYPCGSGATANDVLWSGLPLLALAGSTMVSRMAGSLLRAVSLPELVASSYDDYFAKAVHYAEHPEELKVLRERLATNKLAHPLFDTPRFVRNLEKGFKVMAQRAWTGQEPAHITVSE